MSFNILTEKRTALIRGSGVDIRKYRFIPEAEGKIRVVFISRMLKDKGIEEFVGAARKIKDKGIGADIVLVGGIDSANPSSLTEEELSAWHNEGILSWWGHHDNISEIMENSHIICLPSHREGLPKVLLEAAACGRPIIASDVPGCREIVINEVNGILVPVKDADALAVAMESLIKNKKLRERYGENGRKMAETEFSEEIINKQTLDLYKKALEEVNKHAGSPPG